MATEHLRRLWREAQHRARARRAAGIAARPRAIKDSFAQKTLGVRRAHAPTADHPWVGHRGLFERAAGGEDFDREPETITLERASALLGMHLDLDS